MFKSTIIAIASVLAVAPAFAQEVTFNSDGRPERIFHPAKGLDNVDVRFVKVAITTDKFEIEASQIAQDNGGSDFVKEYAKEMVTDHKAALIEAQQWAETKGVAMPDELPKELQAKLNHLRNLHGDAFDNAFRDIQRAGHEDCIQFFKSEVENGHDDDVKAMAVKELPTIELHYKLMLVGKTMMGATAADHGM